MYIYEGNRPAASVASQMRRCNTRTPSAQSFLWQSSERSPDNGSPVGSSTEQPAPRTSTTLPPPGEEMPCKMAEGRSEGLGSALIDWMVRMMVAKGTCLPASRSARDICVRSQSARSNTRPSCRVHRRSAVNRFREIQGRSIYPQFVHAVKMHLVLLGDFATRIRASSGSTSNVAQLG